MRIIAGLAKGRNISAVAQSTRPTSDRAREALFSSLASEFGEFDGLNVLDLYAGTGAIGLEALSRGSSTVHCVCLLYTSPSPRDRQKSRMPSSA